MQKMLVQVKLNFFMTVTAMENKNYTARNLLSFRSAYIVYYLSTYLSVSINLQHFLRTLAQFYNFIQNPTTSYREKLLREKKNSKIFFECSLCAYFTTK